MCLLLFVPYIARLDGTIVMWFIPVACLVPFAILPLFYLIIHKSDMLLFGRYHLALPISAFVAAFFFAMAWSARDGGPAGNCLIFFGALFFVSAIAVHRYCAFSVRARLTGGGIVSSAPFNEILCAAGAAAAVVVFFGFLYYDEETAYINTAFVLSGVSIVLAMTQYLATHYGIPRLGGRRRARTVKSVFAAFYGGLDRKMYFSALFFESAFSTISALIVYFGFFAGAGVYRTVIAAATLVGVYALAACACTRIVKRRTVMLSAMEFVCATCACVLLVCAAATELGGDGLYACLIAAAVLTGLGGAVSVRQTKLRFLTIKSRITIGTVYILLELTMLAAAAIAFTVASVVITVISYSGDITGFIYGFAAATVLAVVAMALAGRSKRAVAESDGDIGDIIDKTIGMA